VVDFTPEKSVKIGHCGEKSPSRTINAAKRRPTKRRSYDRKSEPVYNQVLIRAVGNNGTGIAIATYLL